MARVFMYLLSTLFVPSLCLCDSVANCHSKDIRKAAEVAHGAKTNDTTRKAASK